MSKNELRMSQVITTFGPGAMVDLPTRSVVISGLDLWTNQSSYEEIDEPRLREMIERELKGNGRFPEDKYLKLRKPPALDESDFTNRSGRVVALIFPTWFLCDPEKQDDSGTSRRRLVHWMNLEAHTGKYRDGSKAVEVSPIRFVGACKDGHLQDLDWRWLVHEGGNCQAPMWLEDRGTSADPKDISIKCDCGREILMENLFVHGRLGRCQGHQPWLGANADRAVCTESLRFLTRGATNAYFPQVARVISIPLADDALTGLVRKHIGTLANAASVDMLRGYFQMVPTVAKEFEGYSVEQVFSRLVEITQNSTGPEDTRIQSPKDAEFNILSSGDAEIGENTVHSNLYAKSLGKPAETGPQPICDMIQNVVAVHRLREVTCLYGFTRLEPAPVASDGMLDEIFLAVEGQPLGRDTDWLPAIEQFGEGIFIQFSAERVRTWSAQPHLAPRLLQMRVAYDGWTQRFASSPRFPGGEYVLLHSLSHVLMTEIALDCGYPASSLRERIYTLDGGRYGILIYTAASGAQGSLGGLVESAARIPKLISRALHRHEICSNDPICSDQQPSLSPDGTIVNGSACHSCLLVSETSCEFRNMLLDRHVLDVSGGSSMS